MPQRHKTLCGKSLRGVLHACAFVDSTDQSRDVLLPFLKEGYRNGERVVGLVAPERQGSHADWLHHSGLKIDAGVELKTWSHCYLQGGRFSSDRMLRTLSDLLDGARERGFSGLRAFGEMDWALTGLPGTDELLEYEARVNDVMQAYDDPVVCVYDVNRFGGRVLMDILSTHPLVVLGMRAYENQYYVPPREFLTQLQKRKRRARRR
jgi:hypothetical protein